MTPDPVPSLFDPADDTAEAHALAEAEADLASGRVISHAAVKTWLRSWGTENEQPPPACGK